MGCFEPMLATEGRTSRGHVVAREVPVGCALLRAWTHYIPGASPREGSGRAFRATHDARPRFDALRRSAGEATFLNGSLWASTNML